MLHPPESRVGGKQWRFAPHGDLGTGSFDAGQHLPAQPVVVAQDAGTHRDTYTLTYASTYGSSVSSANSHADACSHTVAYCDTNACTHACSDRWTDVSW